MPTQAEIWVDLRLRSHWTLMLTMTGQEYREYQEWLAQVEAAVQPGPWWEEMIHTHQGRHIRLTRGDFPDGSTVIGNETWCKLHRGECDVSAYQYCLLWASVPIQ
jgi:hypothetical protein